MRSTGTNSRSKEKLLSIRLSSDGLSFWTEAVEWAIGGGPVEYSIKEGNASEETSVVLSRELAPGERIRSALSRCAAASGWTGGPVRVMPDTLKSVLVPAGLFDPARVGDYLMVNGIAVGPDEETVVSRLAGDGISAMAIMVCDREAVDAVADVFGACARFTSPFEATTVGMKHKKKHTGKEFATLYLTGENVYLTVRAIPGGEWRYCEALPYSTTADILYYMQELATRFDIRKTPLHVSGEAAEKVAKALRKTFRR